MIIKVGLSTDKWGVIQVRTIVWYSKTDLDVVIVLS